MFWISGESQVCSKEQNCSRKNIFWWREGRQQNEDRIGLRIGSDRTGIFAFGTEEVFWEKPFLIMTQVARNKKSEFSQQESNLKLVQTNRVEYFQMSQVEVAGVGAR